MGKKRNKLDIEELGEEELEDLEEKLTKKKKKRIISKYKPSRRGKG